jgi:hypothetical protein
MNQPGLKISPILIPLIIEVVRIWQGSLIGGADFTCIFLISLVGYIFVPPMTLAIVDKGVQAS